MGAKFYLYNGVETLGLNGETGVWFKSITGLGASITSEFAHISGGNYARTLRTEAQGAIDAEVFFLNDPYAAFENLNAFINSDTLELWQTVNGTTYKRAVVLRSLARTDRDKKSNRADISFYTLTAWTTEETQTGATLTVTALGHLETTIKVSATLAAASSFTIDAGQYGVCQIVTTIEDGDTLNYSSVPTDAHVYINGADVINAVDISTTPFIRIPSGATATITCDSAVTLTAVHSWRGV